MKLETRYGLLSRTEAVFLVEPQTRARSFQKGSLVDVRK